MPCNRCHRKAKSGFLSCSQRNYERISSVRPSVTKDTKEFDVCMWVEFGIHLRVLYPWRAGNWRVLELHVAAQIGAALTTRPRDNRRFRHRCSSLPTTPSSLFLRHFTSLAPSGTLTLAIANVLSYNSNGSREVSWGEGRANRFVKILFH